MNRSQRNFGLMTAMAMMASINPQQYIEVNKVATIKNQEYKRKKCKSCKLFPCNNDKHKWKSNPLAEACEKYTKKPIKTNP